VETDILILLVFISMLTIINVVSVMYIYHEFDFFKKRFEDEIKHLKNVNSIQNIAIKKFVNNEKKFINKSLKYEK